MKYFLTYELINPIKHLFPKKVNKKNLQKINFGGFSLIKYILE